MNVAHFYHVWCDGAWGDAVSEHTHALLTADFRGGVHLGLVGSRAHRAAALHAFRDVPHVTVAAEADEGFEQVTLTAVRAYVAEHDGAVLYAHTKGAHDVSEFRAAWRRSMCRRVVECWRENTGILDAYDAVGPHWLTPREFPGMVETPFFGGNYWMARCDYLRTLPDCATDSRFAAERWIGLCSPKVLDLAPGWPAMEVFCD